MPEKDNPCPQNNRHSVPTMDLEEVPPRIKRFPTFGGWRSVSHLAILQHVCRPLTLFLPADDRCRCLLSGVVVCLSTRFSENRTTSMSHSRSRTIGAC